MKLEIIKKFSARNKSCYHFDGNGSHVAKKRWLFLTDSHGMKWTPDYKRMLKARGSIISLLDPEGSESIQALR